MSEIKTQFRAEQAVPANGGVQVPADRSVEAMQRLRLPFAVDTTITGATDRQGAAGLV